MCVECSVTDKLPEYNRIRHILQVHLRTILINGRKKNKKKTLTMLGIHGDLHMCQYRAFFFIKVDRFDDETCCR